MKENYILKKVGNLLLKFNKRVLLFKSGTKINLIKDKDNNIQSVTYIGYDKNFLQSYLAIPDVSYVFVKEELMEYVTSLGIKNVRNIDDAMLMKDLLKSGSSILIFPEINLNLSDNKYINTLNKNFIKSIVYNAINNNASIASIFKVGEDTYITNKVYMLDLIYNIINKAFKDVIKDKCKDSKEFDFIKKNYALEDENNIDSSIVDLFIYYYFHNDRFVSDDLNNFLGYLVNELEEDVISTLCESIYICYKKEKENKCKYSYLKYNCDDITFRENFLYKLKYVPKSYDDAVHHATNLFSDFKDSDAIWLLLSFILNNLTEVNYLTYFHDLDLKLKSCEIYVKNNIKLDYSSKKLYSLYKSAELSDLKDKWEEEKKYIR